MNFLRKALNLYIDGFRNLLVTEKKVWLIILSKLFIMFFILKLFFFPNILKRDFSPGEDSSNHIIKELTNP
jgi:hypothetical protein